MVVSTGYLIAGILLVLVGIFIFAIRSYEPSFGGYYWGTLIILGLLIVIFIGGFPYNWISGGLILIIIVCFLRGSAFLTLFSLDPDPLYIQKDPTVWDLPTLPIETNQTDQDHAVEEST